LRRKNLKFKKTKQVTKINQVPQILLTQLDTNLVFVDENRKAMIDHADDLFREPKPRLVAIQVDGDSETTDAIKNISYFQGIQLVVLMRLCCMLDHLVDCLRETGVAAES
jgi:hypothetical protein